VLLRSGRISSNKAKIPRARSRSAVALQPCGDSGVFCAFGGAGVFGLRIPKITDSAQAAARFERAAGELSDAAPLLLALAARVETARRQERPAIALWQRIVQRFAAAPEAAEADLEWGRLLRRRGDTGGAVERFEHLILTYPQSALVPQARRELEAVRSGAAAE